MMTSVFGMWIIFAIIVSATVAFMVMRPILESGPAGSGENDDSLQALLDRKQHSLQILKDLELDHRMMKISDDEFERLKAAGMSELAPILAAIDGWNRGRTRSN